jgi:hypothetical protein
MIRKIAISILLLIIVASCAAPHPETPTQVAVLESPQPTAIQRADIGDGGMFSGLPCPAPCVYGIRIGETPLDQVIPRLQQNGLSECQREDSISWIEIICGNSVVVQVDSATSVVNATSFYPSVPISLGEIIETYGEPNYIVLQAEGATEEPTSHMNVFWDSIKMMVTMPVINSHLYALEGTTMAEIVTFLDDLQYFDSSELEFGQFYQRWNGYGTYQP